MSKSSELIYTSAPRGLRPGSRGFCTVAMSESMPAGLVGPLEGLSAYRHVDGDGPSPINHMHVQMKVAGRFVNVLSRISDAPPDYTGRTNKLAHHVVVATVDQTAGGPAAVLRQPGFAIESWDGEVRKIHESKTIPSAESPARIADTWAEKSGDAGWAGTVASIFESRDPGPPLYLIYRPEQNDQLLALIDEAICLLPEPERWNATFSTHTGELPPGVNCRLRCLIAGSSEASTLPPSAMTLDLATGTLNAPSGTWNSPTPGPLVDAARSGRLALPDIMPAEIPTPGGQTEIPIAANQSASFEADEPSFALQPPPSTIPLPPPAEESSSSTRSYAWPLMVAALFLLCFGGAIAMLVLQTDSDDLLAELNASAGIKNLPAEDVSQEVQQEPVSESELDTEPESGMKPDVVQDTEADADSNAELPNVDLKKKESLEELAKKVLDGEAFLGSDDKQSITKFSDRVKNELQGLAEQKKQLEETFPQPTDEQFASWVRAEDGIQQLNGFIDVRKKDIKTLNQHLPLKDLQAYRERLIGELKAWDIEAKKWEGEKERRSDLILQVPDSFIVDQTITKIRATATTHLQKSMPGLLDQYEKLSIEKTKLAATIEKRLDPLLKELVADLRRRRDSHRLAIYFDGDSRRSEDRLQIKPRCIITLNPDVLAAINRLSIDDSKPIPLSHSSDDVKLPGAYEGWLTVMRGDSGIVLKLNPRTIVPVVRVQHPMLQQLDRFVKQQDATFKSNRSLQTTFEANLGKVNSGIGQWRQKYRNAPEELKKIPMWESTVAQMKQLLNQKTAKGLDNLYIEQTDQTENSLRTLEPNITELFQKFVTPNVAIKVKIDEHSKNLETLRVSYVQLKANKGLLDFEGQLVFGNASGSRLGQSTFETVETFDLFFIPELVYGPPPKE
ncbi:hypothetical protein [Rhodopirellula bahusiensis]